MWYSFDYGLVHFVSKNTETGFPNAAEATDAPHSDLPWIVKDVDPVNLEVELAHTPLFKQYGVDFWISGHRQGYHQYLPVEGSDEIPLVCNGGVGNPGGLDDPFLSLSGRRTAVTTSSCPRYRDWDALRDSDPPTFTAYKSEGRNF